MMVRQWAGALLLMGLAAACQSDPRRVDTANPGETVEASSDLASGGTVNNTPLPDTTTLDDNAQAQQENVQGQTVPQPIGGEGGEQQGGLDVQDALGGATETYVSENAGFAFDYPASWHVTEGGDGTVALTSFPVEEAGSVGSLRAVN